MRQRSFLDKLLCEVDTALRTLIVPKHRCNRRVNPGQGISEQSLNPEEKRRVAGLMRVNHAGEVCAQALYQGQTQMTEAAAEEVDHLAWCEERLRELGSRPSVLNPIWYSGSLMIGALAGLAGDKWSLGFVAETERQVTDHLQKHLQHLPPQDVKTKAILSKMQDDEAHHAEMAHAAGAAELPFMIKKIMHCVSTVMTKSSYYI